LVWGCSSTPSRARLDRTSLSTDDRRNNISSPDLINRDATSSGHGKIFPGGLRMLDF
jgi:hypothetical protein